MTLNLDSIADDVEADEHASLELGESGDFKPLGNNEANPESALAEMFSELIYSAKRLVSLRRYEEAHKLALRLERGEAEELGAGGILVPRTLINSGGYEAIMKLKALDLGEAVKCARVFNGFKWGYWLPEKYWPEVFGTNGMPQIVSNSQSPKVYKAGSGE